MKKILKLLALTLAIALLAAMAMGCGSSSSSASSGTTGGASSSVATGDSSTGGDESTGGESTGHKVACILSGPISDMSWNATAYNGMLEIEKMGAEIACQENVENSSLADAISTYATEGFDIIFLSTNSYEDIGVQEAKNYPEVTFMIINGATTSDNVVSIQVADEQQGFMMGAIAALVAGEGQVGFVGGMEITPIINGGKGFEAGVAYVNEAIQVNSAMTGSMTDVNAAKETAKAMIDNGAAVVAPMADNASLGVLEAAQEGGVYAVASGLNQEEVAPDAVLISVVKDTAIAYKAAYQAYLDGTLATETNKMGAAEGVVFLSDWYAAGDNIDQSIKDEVQKIYDDLAAGNIAIEI